MLPAGAGGEASEEDDVARGEQRGPAGVPQLRGRGAPL